MQEELGCLLRQLTDRRGALLRELSAVEYEISNVGARYNKLCNQTTPFFKLPPEVIVTIFENCRDQWRTSTPFEVVASHVSSRWREIVLRDPLFWSTIDITVGGPLRERACPLDKIQVYLSRSLPCLLDITLRDLNPLPDSRAIGNAISMLLPHSPRWRRLCVVLDSPVTADIYQVLHGLPTPMLEYVSFRIKYPAADRNQDPGPYPNCPSLLPQVFEGASSLSFIRLAEMALWTLQPSLSTVTTLHLEGWEMMYMMPQQFRTLMSTMSCLVNLSLSRFSIITLGNILDGSNPRMPSLKRIRLCGEETQPGVVLSLMDLPFLEALNLQEIESFDFFRILPTICSITFELCSLSQDELRNVIRSSPAVSSLIMDQSVQALYDLLGSEGQEWPDLETVSVHDLIPVNVQWFCNMVHSRCQSGKPLAAVRLDRRSRNVLRNKCRLQWLHDIVRVEKWDNDEPWPTGLEFHDPDDTWS
ncbi:hypothetical protein AX17_006571 [Amanita inopinata Kibby_2008]|nr:hypothetical protein AX17_006571 [Amanita inopinata Kibby_2008]